MTSLSNKREFLESPLAKSLRQELLDMVTDSHYNTRIRTLSPATDGSDFVEKHMAYMCNHLQMNHQQYVSNIKLMTRVNKTT